MHCPAGHCEPLDNAPGVWYPLHTAKGACSVAFDQSKYAQEYNKENYDVIRATVPKGCRKVLRQEASERGISLSQLIVDALEYAYKLDLSKGNGG